MAHAIDLVDGWSNWMMFRTQPAQAAGRADDFGKPLSRLDDRLLADVGLTRDEALGPEQSFWRDWLLIKSPWNL